MIPKQVIEKAIEGGWKEHRGFSFQAAVVIDDRVMLLQEREATPVTAFTTQEAVVLDREFWLGLGEALEWKKTDVGQGVCGLGTQRSQVPGFDAFGREGC